MSADDLRVYVQLLGEFLDQTMGAEEFERRYLALFKGDQARRPQREFLVLDRLFADVDAFVADPALRDEGDLDVEELLAAARRALHALQQQQRE